MPLLLLPNRPKKHTQPLIKNPLQAAALFASLRWASSWFASLDAESLAAVAAAVEASSSLGGSSKTKKKPSSSASPSLFDEPTRSLSVIVPAYNEEARLPSALDEALSFLDGRRDRLGPSFSFEVVIVDDGSTDGTARVAESYAKRRGGADAVRLVKMAKNSGKGAAVRAGALGVRGARLLMMDADGATKVSDLDRMDEALDLLVSREMEKRRRKMEVGKGSGSGGSGARVLASASATSTSTTTTLPAADAAAFAFASPALPPAWTVPAAALGSRAHLAPGVAARRAAHRNFLMRGFRLLVAAVAGDSVKDTQCGFKLFTRGGARALFGNQRLQRWCFDVELVHLATSRLPKEEGSSSSGTSEGDGGGGDSGVAVPLAEVAVNWQEIPGSKVRVSSILHMAFEMAAILVGYGTGAWVARGESDLVEAAREFAATELSASKKKVA